MSRARSAREAFAENLRQARLDKGWSQMVLAEAAGLHFTYVSSVEGAKRNVSIDAMERLAKAVGVPLSDLLLPVTEKRR
ncbi:helix-turn-helix domain-containing protein [Geothrix limicola]|uniref:helix-turn-helix domain-containing protein n=1 Tax=Geothrix limicola TaxID=2927978 RepID=UPI002555EC44|nr:helix-turn-helix transcriptional regulator [Geothrix limicola]